MHKSSVFKLKIDFEKSHGSYLIDKNSGREFLDFFGMYSTVTLGYSHPIFKESAFLKDIQRVAHLRTTNCEMASSEAERFYERFTSHPAMKPFEHFHFACTGALGVEAAIKVAMDQKGSKNPKVISLRESFHGINSYGGFVTDRFFPVSTRLENFPELGWYKIHNPKIIYKNGEIDLAATERGLERFKQELEGCLEEGGKENIVALLVEPIQATAGDQYFPESFFKQIRTFCDRHQICLIFDEIQTGFGVTGKMWYHQYQDILPDIVVFGKKAQVCGIMCRQPFQETFKKPGRLEVTWDGELIDMIRSTYVLEAFDKYSILENVAARGLQLLRGLQSLSDVFNARGKGLLVAFDLETSEHQEKFFKRAFGQGLLFNRTREKTIRLRPHLAVSEEEISRGLEMIQKSL